MEKQPKTKMKTFEMNDLPIVETPKIDIREYIGTRVEVEKANIVSTQYGRAILFETEVVATIGDDKKKVELKGSKMLSLTQDENGNWGIG